MSKTVVKWHPYPKEKPETYKYCFVTIETLGKKKQRFVEVDFLAYFWLWGFYWAGHKYWNIVAWADLTDSYIKGLSREFPEPYNPEEKQ